MPDGMFGAPVGQSAAIQDTYNLARLAMVPSSIQQHMAAARYMGARADLTERAVRTQDIIAQEMARAGKPGGGPGEAAQRNPLWSLAYAASRAGDPKTAMQAANYASLVDYRQIAGEAQAARGAEAKIKVQTGNLDLLGRLVGGATDDLSLQTALRDFESQTGSVTGLLGPDGKLIVPYSKDLVQNIQRHALSTKDQMMMDYRNSVLDSLNKERGSQQAHRKFWENMDNQRKRAEAQAQGRQAAKGDVTGTIKPSDITQATDYIGLQFNVDKQEPWARVMGRDLAENIKRLMQQNRALTYADARKQAFQEMDKGGAFLGHRLAKQPGDRRDPNLDRPIPLPASGNKKDLIEDQSYIDTTTGAVRKWTGTGWTTPTEPIRGVPRVGPQSMLPQSNYMPGDDSEEDQADQDEADRLAMDEGDE